MMPTRLLNFAVPAFQFLIPLFQSFILPSFQYLDISGFRLFRISPLEFRIFHG